MKSNAIEYINHEMKVEEEVEEETEEETKEEEKENLDHFDTYPTMNELRLEPRRKPSNAKKNYNFIGRVRRLKVFVGNFTYECDFMVLEDTTSVIVHYLGSVVFKNPFVEATKLVYNKEKRTVVFERDKEKIVFKIPHKMDMLKHIDFTDISTDHIPPFVIESGGDNCKKTHYSDNLDLGPEYKYDAYVYRSIQSLMATKSKRKNKGEVIDAPDKLDPRYIKCIFVGYTKEMMGYYFYYPLENKIFVARNAKFFENSLMVDPQNVQVPIRRSARIPQAPNRYVFYVDVEEYELGDLNEPPNYKATLLDLEFDKWLEAMNVEMQSMKDNQVLVLVDHPSNDIRAIRILLAIAAFYDYEIWQMDVKTNFLNGYLREDVYMVQPKGFVDLKHPNKVCKPQCSIYGLKQESKSWNKRFDVEIKKIGFTYNPDELCVYLKASRSNVAFLILYVNDILLMGNNVTMLQEVKSWLCKCFSMKELGEAAYILGIKIIRDRSMWLIDLSQSSYLEKILDRFWMENSKKGYNLMIEKPDYRKSQGAKTPSEVQHIQRVPYASAIAILKYLKNTKDMVLVYEAKPEVELKKSAKQSTTAMSSTKAKYIDVVEESMEAVWMWKFIDGLGGVVPSNKRPMEILCDNEPAIAMANDPRILKGAIHFQRNYHYIHEVIQEHEIVLKKVHTDDNVADPFTIPMSYDKHYEHAMTIRIVPARSLMLPNVKKVSSRNLKEMRRNIKFVTTPDVKTSRRTCSRAYEKLKMMIYKSKFLRAEPGVSEEDTQPSENTSKIHNEVASIEVDPQNVQVPIRRSARIPQAPDRYVLYVDVEEYELGDLNEPPNYKATLLDPEFDKWLEAMNVEMQSMKDNQVLVLVDHPSNGRIVRNKWLFKKKTNIDGNVHTFKAFLIAKGYTQTYDVDYGETFSPIADIRAIRILLAIAAFYDYEIWQMDVKTNFLNGYLSEDVYMVQPKGFVDPKHPNKVCKLQRFIYGLKQESRSWNKRFDVEIKKIGFTYNPDELCVYLKASRSNVAFLILYVNDILLMGNNVTMLQEVKSWLCKYFSMKELGEAAYILGIKIIRDRSMWLIALSQSAYLEKILERFWMENSKKGYNLMIEKPDYRKSQGAKTPSEVQHIQRVPYALAIAIRKYLKNTKDMVFVYEAKPEAELKKSAKQSTTAMSSTKAKYIDVVEESMEAVWMRKFIDGLGGVVPSNKRPMEILCDNEPAIAMANDPRILKGAIHFQRNYHYIYEVIQEHEIILKKVHTDDNVADPFTKPMSYDKHYEHAMAIRIVPARSLM
nr:hypothetical protein [Tanacetum cinerariifolium]